MSNRQPQLRNKFDRIAYINELNIDEIVKSANIAMDRFNKRINREG